MNFFVYAILIASLIFSCGAACDERTGAGSSSPPSVCLPELTPESDPLPEADFLLAARTVERGREDGYICQILKGQHVTYREVDQAELIRLCDGSKRTRGCYAPGLGEHAIYVLEDSPGWVVRHESYHLLLCLGPGLCTEDESHTWMGRRGIPGVPEHRKPPD